MYIKYFYKITGLLVITSLLAQDFARCMQNENEEQNKQIIIPSTLINKKTSQEIIPLAIFEKEDTTHEKFESDNSDQSPQKTPRSNENSFEEFQDSPSPSQKSTDSHSPTSSDEQLTLPLTPSPEKNLGTFIPSQNEEKKKDLLVNQNTDLGDKEAKVEERTNSQENKEVDIKTLPPSNTKPILPFDKEKGSKNNFELVLLNKEKSTSFVINEIKEEYDEETHLLVGQKDKKSNSDSTDSFLFLDEDSEEGEKKGCCCNRPCWPKRQSHWFKSIKLQKVKKSMR